MSEVKRYKYGYRDDGNGQRFLGLIESSDGSVVLASDYYQLKAENEHLASHINKMIPARDTLRKQVDEARIEAAGIAGRCDALSIKLDEARELLGAYGGGNSEIEDWLEANK